VPLTKLERGLKIEGRTTVESVLEVILGLFQMMFFYNTGAGLSKTRNFNLEW